MTVRHTKREHARTRHIWTHPFATETEANAKRRAHRRSPVPAERHHAHDVEARSVHRLPDSRTSRGHGHSETGAAAEDGRAARRRDTHGPAVHHVRVREQHGLGVFGGAPAVQRHVRGRENAAHALKHDADAVARASRR